MTIHLISILPFYSIATFMPHDNSSCLFMVYVWSSHSIYYYACNMQFHSSTSSTNAWPAAIIFHYNTSFSFSVYIYSATHRRKGTNHRQMLRAYVSSSCWFQSFEGVRSIILLLCWWFIFSLLFPRAKISTRRSTLPTHVAACQEDYDRYVCKSFQQLVFLPHISIVRYIANIS